MPKHLDVLFAAAGQERAKLGESPFWDHGDCIWWVDIGGRRLLRTRLPSRTTQAWDTPETPGFVVLTAPDRPMVGMECGIYAFSLSDSRFERVVEFEEAGQRFNDATVDATGRLWASTMAMDARPGGGMLHSVTADLKLQTVLHGLTTPNGLAADMDAGRLFVSDSHPDAQTIWTAPCNFRTAELGIRTVFASMQSLEGRPDGAALATDGRYWIAGVDGGAIYGFSKDGRVDFAVPLPFAAPTKLAWFAGGVAVTAKDDGGYGGQLTLAENISSLLRGPAVPFWRPGDSSTVQ